MKASEGRGCDCPDLVYSQPHVDDLYWLVRLDTLQAPVSQVLVPANKVSRVSGGRLLRRIFREDGRGEEDNILTA